MRVRFDGNPTVRELLDRARETVLGAFEHQDTPLESLVLELGRAANDNVSVTDAVDVELVAPAVISVTLADSPPLNPPSPERRTT